MIDPTMVDPGMVKSGMVKGAAVKAAGVKQTGAQQTHGDASGADITQSCPHPLGSAEAKLWWKGIENKAHAGITPAMKAKYGDKVVGVYQGKPLVPGSKGTVEEPQGDMDMMVDRIRVEQGMDHQTAISMAKQIRALKYGV